MNFKSFYIIKKVSCQITRATWNWHSAPGFIDCLGATLKPIFHWAEFCARSGIFLCFDINSAWRQTDNEKFRPRRKIPRSEKQPSPRVIGCKNYKIHWAARVITRSNFDTSSNLPLDLWNQWNTLFVNHDKQKAVIILKILNGQTIDYLQEMISSRYCHIPLAKPAWQFKPSMQILSLLP